MLIERRNDSIPYEQPQHLYSDQVYEIDGHSFLCSADKPNATYARRKGIAAYERREARRIRDRSIVSSAY
jgi:hypothetical protein